MSPQNPAVHTALTEILGPVSPQRPMYGRVREEAMLCWLVPFFAWRLHAKGRSDAMDRVLRTAPAWGTARSGIESQQAWHEAQLLSAAAPAHRFMEAHQRAASVSWRLLGLVCFGSMGTLATPALMVILPFNGLMALFAHLGLTPWAGSLEVSR